MSGFAINFTFADAATRLAYSVENVDVGQRFLQSDTAALYVATRNGAGEANWEPAFDLDTPNPDIGAGTGTSLTLTAALTAYNATAIPAGGTTGKGVKVSSTANFGVFFGSGAPSLSAAKGSLYLRSDGSGVNDRMYVNTNGTTTWTAVVTVA